MKHTFAFKLLVGSSGSENLVSTSYCMLEQNVQIYEVQYEFEKC